MCGDGQTQRQMAFREAIRSETDPKARMDYQDIDQKRQKYNHETYP